MSEGAILFAVQPEAVQGLATPVDAGEPPGWCIGRRDVFDGVGRDWRVEVHPVRVPLHPERRAACRLDFLRFCETYFPQKYVRPSAFNSEYGAVLQRGILGRGVKRFACAGPRGIGKSAQAQLLAIWAALYRHRRVILLIGANHPQSVKLLKNLQDQLLNNDLLNEDFPEICGPVREFGGDPRNAPSAYPWNTENSKLANGVWICQKSMEEKIRGFNAEMIRTDLLIYMEDIEDNRTVASPTQTAEIRRKVHEEIGGLHEMGGNAFYLLTCNVIAKNCVSAELTSPEKHPEWNGKVWKALLHPPDRVDLWEEYRQIYRGYGGTGELPDDTVRDLLGIDAYEWADMRDSERCALLFYAQNRAAMDAGAVVLDSWRMPLWRYYQYSPEQAAANLQNSPEDNANSITLDLDKHTLNACIVRGRERCRVPEWVVWLVASVDVGLYRLHWEVSGFAGDRGRCCLVDCGIEDTGVDIGGAYTLASGVDKEGVAGGALSGALARLRERFMKLGVVRAGVDTGGAGGGEQNRFAWDGVVKRFCSTTGRLFLPLKGKSPWTDHLSSGAGMNWHMAPEERDNPYGLVLVNSDIYKKRNADFIREQKREFYEGVYSEYLEHQGAERWEQVFTPEKKTEQAVQSRWVQKSSKNHFLDTAYMCHAVAEIHAGSVAQAVKPAARAAVMGLPPRRGAGVL